MRGSVKYPWNTFAYQSYQSTRHKYALSNWHSPSYMNSFMAALELFSDQYNKIYTPAPFKGRSPPLPKVPSEGANLTESWEISRTSGVRGIWNTQLPLYLNSAHQKETYREKLWVPEILVCRWNWRWNGLKGLGVQGVSIIKSITSPQ